MSNVKNIIALTQEAVANSSTGDINFDNNTLYVDKSTDRVGVGTTTPATALDVSGEIKATDFTVGSSGKLTSNNYIQAQGFGTGDVSNNYLQSQLGGASFTGAAGIFSDFSGNSALALRNNFSTSTDYNVGGFTVATTGITVPSDGYYDCFVNLYMTSSSFRTNIGLRFYIDSTVQDPISASNYIRAASGHNEASTNLRMILYMTAGQQFRIGTEQLSNSGTVTIQGANSNWIIQKVG